MKTVIVKFIVLYFSVKNSQKSSLYVAISKKSNFIWQGIQQDIIIITNYAWYLIHYAISFKMKSYSTEEIIRKHFNCCLEN
jgi:hypothetical protein